jgi:hypothetical protein
MTRDSYKKAFSDLKSDITRLLGEREGHEESLRSIDAQLRQLGASVRIVGQLSGADPEEIEAWSNFDSSSQPGLTNAVLRSLFTFSERSPVTAIEIRNTIANAKMIDLGKYSNVLASIYTVLGRLLENSDVEQFTRGDNKRAFKITRKGEERFRGLPTNRFALDDPNNPLYTSGMRPFPHTKGGSGVINRDVIRTGIERSEMLMKKRAK